ncbi:disulfide bond formation protein B [Dongia sp.]|uniref:disulfide bond formation protein B n=1 Tax=Dongia sp. TaxID=1977262 RepID=UPI0035B08A4A
MPTHRRTAFIEPAHVPWLVAGLGLAALCVAWLAQYGFGLAPCHLCLWQRGAHWATIALALAAIFAGRNKRYRAILLALAGIAALIGAGIALFHVGVEQQWWEGSGACVGGGIAGLSGADLEAAIMNAPVTRCDEAAFEMFGISMAGYNGLFALGLALFAFWGARNLLKGDRA